MNKFWLLVLLSVVLGTTFGWAMNYTDYGHRTPMFGEITMDGAVTADNVMDKLAEYYVDDASSAVADLEGDSTHDFGTMAPDSSGSHTFVIKNSGSAPLKLELGASTCKCTLGSLEDKELAPGESTTVDMEWKVTADKTRFEQSAELRTNDPKRPAIRLVVRGLVIREIEFFPAKITFGEVPAGETFEFSTTMFSYFPSKIDVTNARFGSEDLTDLSDVVIEEVDPADAEGIHQNATQAFRLKVKVKPGLRQGPLITSMAVSFTKPEADGGDGQPQSDQYYASTECAGNVIGSLTMLETSKVKRTNGAYILNLGRLDKTGALEFKAFVALKGSERDATNLTIGETYPSDVIQAEFGDAKGQGKMRLFPLIVKLTPSEETIDLLGKNKDDFGWVWIESDNPKVSRLRVAVKVLLEPRP